jgi:hypothetical protein
MRRCLLEDFGGGEHAEEIFGVWEGFLIFCPITEGVEGKMKLDGHRGMMKTSTFDFRVSRCVNKTTCRTEKEIDHFLRDL